MSCSLLRFAVAAVRAWTWLYTRRVEPALAEARREDIESDLWEYQHDPTSDDRHPAVHILTRLVMGVPSDLGWRVEHVPSVDQTIRSKPALAAAVIAAAALWIVPMWLSRSDATEPLRVDQCAGASTLASTGSPTRTDYRMRVFACVGALLSGRPPASGPQ